MGANPTFQKMVLEIYANLGRRDITRGGVGTFSKLLASLKSEKIKDGYKISLNFRNFNKLLH